MPSCSAVCASHTSKLQILGFHGVVSQQKTNLLAVTEKVMYLVFLAVIISPKSPQIRDKYINESQAPTGPSTWSGQCDTSAHSMFVRGSGKSHHTKATDFTI